jgi:hypothetical protein
MLKGLTIGSFNQLSKLTPHHGDFQVIEGIDLILNLNLTSGAQKLSYFLHQHIQLIFFLQLMT